MAITNSKKRFLFVIIFDPHLLIGVYYIKIGKSIGII